MPAPNQAQTTATNAPPRAGVPSSHDLLPAEALNTKEYLESAVMPVVTQALKQLAIDRPPNPFEYLAIYLMEYSKQAKEPN